MFDENDKEVQPGSDAIGMIANGGTVPVGYYKDPEKSAQTFRTIGGTRYAFPGDFAKVTTDGSLILLGRGSVCINTGGEKVFPEEVEEALKEFTRSRLAGYKMPRQFDIVDMIQRAANGKADYKWAKETALAAMI